MLSQPSAATVSKKPNSKLLKAKDGLNSARNLYIIDYLKTHPNATDAEFAAVWKECDPEIKKKYQDLAKEATKAQKLMNKITPD
ncbi:hypothetical protein C0992_012772 [Termitomyces sp. T32_za158]|nr:hypothetical protein C0992_012772 [Termitomyces sp. T32_za158]